MKKIIIALVATALVTLGYSCKNDSDKTYVNTNIESPAKKNSEKGKKYIAELAKNDTAVKVLPSGLAYKMIKPGDGKNPTMDDIVRVNYTGKHMDGSVFDSSKGEPAEFPLRGVVPGFAEGIVNMPVGATYELYIPGELGYGENGQPMAGIEPNELLIFEVELVGIK